MNTMECIKTTQETEEFLLDSEGMREVSIEHGIYPMNFEGSQPSMEALQLYFSWMAHMNIKLEKDLFPWVPVGVLGAVPIVGHHDLSQCSVMFPLEVSQKVMLTKEDYFRILDNLDVKQLNLPIIQCSSDIKNINKQFKQPKIIDRESFLEYVLSSMLLTDELRTEIDPLTKKDIWGWADWPEGFEAMFHCLAFSKNLIDLKNVSIDPSIEQILPEHISQGYHCLAFLKLEDTLFVAIKSNPKSNFHNLIGNSLEMSLSDKIQHVQFCLTSQKNVEDKKSILAKGKSLQKTYTVNKKESKADSSRDLLVIDEHQVELFDIKKEGYSTEVFFTWLLVQAMKSDVSDIHIEQWKNRGRVRFRIDGDLKVVLEPSLEEMRSLVTVAKNACSMGSNTFDNEDAALSIQLGDEKRGLRFSVIPFRKSFQKMVIRLLPKSDSIVNLNQLDISEENLKNLKQASSQEQGLILITGPTGSGKTTTLYSALTEINTDDRNIQTIEDPIEKEIDGINQTAVDNKRDITFSKIMSTIVRQDPNVILLGEIRDKESAELAIRAADTGHLVFATLHANSAVKAIQRLSNLGVKGCVLGDVLILLQAQRLVKRLCTSCRKEIELSDLDKEEFKKNQVEVREKVYTSVGCRTCGNTGYLGRSVVMETVPVDETFSELVSQNASVSEMRSSADKKGHGTLYKDALIRVSEGKTSMEEATKFKPVWE